MVNQDYGAPQPTTSAPMDRDPMKYTNCEGVDEDIRSLYDAYGSNDAPDAIGRLAEQLAATLETGRGE